MYIIVWAAPLLVFSAVCDEVGRASPWVETARIRSQGYVDCILKNVVSLPFLEESFCSQLMQVIIACLVFCLPWLFPVVDARRVRQIRFEKKLHTKRRGFCQSGYFVAAGRVYRSRTVGVVS